MDVAVLESVQLRFKFSIYLSIQWNPDFSNHQENVRKLVWNPGERFAKSGVNFSWLFLPREQNIASNNWEVPKIEARLIEKSVFHCYVLSSPAKTETNSVRLLSYENNLRKDFKMTIPYSLVPRSIRARSRKGCANPMPNNIRKIWFRKLCTVHPETLNDPYIAENSDSDHKQFDFLF